MMKNKIPGGGIRFLMFAFSLFMFLLPNLATAAEINVQDGTELNFTVVREGKDIGIHSMKFSRSGDTVTVDIKTDVEVKLLFIPVYHFNHESEEVWQDGRLARLTSVSDDDGTNHVLSVTGTTSALEITGDGNSSTAPASIIPASLWHPGLTHQGQSNILNTLDGHPMAVDVRFDGK